MAWFLCLPCAILTSFLRREKSFAQAKRYVYLKIIPSIFYIPNLIEFWDMALGEKDDYFDQPIVKTLESTLLLRVVQKY